MTINKITNTPIVAKHYGSLALRQMRHQSHGNCVIQSDGTLWMAVHFPTGYVWIYRSTDNGFSWEKVLNAAEYNQRSSSGGSAKGPLIYLVIEEQYRNLDVISVEWEGVGSTWLVNRQRYELDDLTAAPTNTAGIIDYANSNGVIDFCFNHRNGYLIFNDGSSNISAMLFSPRSVSVSAEVDDADAVASGPGPAACCDEDGVVYCAYTKTAVNAVRFNKFTSDESNGSWGTPVDIHDLGQTDRWGDDVVIARDGLGKICVAYGNRDTSANTVALTYATSVDDGATWDVNAVARESGYEKYIEPVNSLATSYVDLIAGSKGGFILTYCDKETADGFGHTFVRQLTTSDAGATYDLGDQKEIGTRYDGRDVIGARFFRPPDIKLMDFGDPGLVRIAYTVDEGDDQDGTEDVNPVTIAQELLSEVAFPSQLTTDTGSYTQDTAGAGELLVSFNIVGSPQDNIDFFTAGMTGDQTQKYTAAFNKVGTNVRLLRHEPDEANFMNDRSAYASSTESKTLAIFDPISYAFPTPQIDATGADSWIERDTRKIYLPAATHLARTFVVNKGGYLKRTVWLTEYDGNQYEISQVVPRFISNQICYYEANAYVVGPSRDPFSRTVLPSET